MILNIILNLKNKISNKQSYDKYRNLIKFSVVQIRHPKKSGNRKYVGIPLKCKQFTFEGLDYNMRDVSNSSCLAKRCL